MGEGADGPTFPPKQTELGRSTDGMASTALPLLRASGESPSPQRKTTPRRAKNTPGVDTRIHWSNPEEGWVGAKSRLDSATSNKRENLGNRFADLISSSDSTSISHYQFLGVEENADSEEIKSAYRRLSKEYHPDTTELPLKTASVKFIRLREAYKVLSDDEKRRFYDWTLAQEAASRREARMRMRLEDPLMQDVKNWQSVPDTVDRLDGKNMALSDQAMTALTIDIAIIVFSICCVAYVVLFKEQY